MPPKQVVARKRTRLAAESTSFQLDDDDLKGSIDTQPLIEKNWDDQVPNNVNLPLLATFDGNNDPHEHIIIVNT